MQISIDDINRELSKVDRKDVLSLAKGSPSLRVALEMSRPVNWWGTGLSPDTLIAIGKDDGIPISWVPETELLCELASASNRAARVEVLLNNSEKVLRHCQKLVSECTDDWIRDEQELLERAISAFSSGHHEAGMALAVSIGESLAIWASTPRVKGFSSEAEKTSWEHNRKVAGKYRWAEQELREIPATISSHDVLRHALIAPIPSFFRQFRVEAGDTVPEQLCRHVVAHLPVVEHFSLENSLLAIMLDTSILREMQDWCIEVRMMDAPEDSDE